MIKACRLFDLGDSCFWEKVAARDDHLTILSTILHYTTTRQVHAKQCITVIG